MGTAPIRHRTAEIVDAPSRSRTGNRVKGKKRGGSRLSRGVRNRNFTGEAPGPVRLSARNPADFTRPA